MGNEAKKRKARRQKQMKSRKRKKIEEKKIVMELNKLILYEHSESVSKESKVRAKLNNFRKRREVGLIFISHDASNRRGRLRSENVHSANSILFSD